MKKVLLLFIFLPLFFCEAQIPGNVGGPHKAVVIDPTTISNLVVRFRSSVGVSTSGSAVTAWLDEVAGINTVQATSALRPTIVSNSLNGYPSIKFVSQYLRAAGQIANLEGETELTVYMLSAGSTPGPYSSVGAGIVTYQSQDFITTYSVALQGNPNHTINVFTANGSNTQASQRSLEDNWTVKGLVINSALASGQRMKIYENGSLKASGNAPTTFSGQANPEFLIGAYSLSSSYTVTDGSIVEIMIFNRDLTDNEDRLVNDYFFNTYGLRKKRLICDGNSLTFGTGSTGGNVYPNYLATSLGSTWQVFNIGVQGQVTSSMVTNAPNQIDNVLGSPYFSKDVIIAWEGTNSLNAGVDATTAYNSMVTYCLARKAAGAKVIVGTCLPRSSVGVPGDFNAQRATYNTLIRNNYQFFSDAILDVAADSRIGDDGDETNTTYYAGDNVHLNNTGYSVIAELALPVVQTF
jgi:lysophospholipase L1-like esterase